MTVYGNRDASVVLVQMADDHDLEGIKREAAEIRRLTGADFCMRVFKVQNWNADLSPWKAPAVFGREDFGDRAEKTLNEVLQYCTEPDRTYIIGGYSLAGLFALWAVYRTDVFAAAAAASPSVWFPGFIDHMKDHQIRTGAVYLSLGDREEKTRNPVMAAVGDRIREAHEWLKGQGINTTLEWNPGNHFRDADLRCARAFAWAIRQCAGADRSPDT